MGPHFGNLPRVLSGKPEGVDETNEPNAWKRYNMILGKGGGGGFIAFAMYKITHMGADHTMRSAVLITILASIACNSVCVGT